MTDNQGLLALGGRRNMASRLVMCAAGDLSEMIQQKNAENSVIVYSRSWCPFCSEVSVLLDKYKVKSKRIELDEIGDGIQSALLDMTGSRTVPQVFIGGTYVGGCDEVYDLHRQGKLQGMLEQANAEFL